MAIPTVPSVLSCSGAPFGAIDADVLVVPWFEDEGPAAVPGIDQASGGEVARALESKEFAGQAYDIFSADAMPTSPSSTQVPGALPASGPERKAKLTGLAPFASSGSSR